MRARHDSHSMGVNTYHPPMACAEGRGVWFECQMSWLSFGGGLQNWWPYLWHLGEGASVAVWVAMLLVFPHLFPWISAEFFDMFTNDPLQPPAAPCARGDEGPSSK